MPKMPGVNQHRFSEVPRAEIPRSSFDRSHPYKTTFDAGLLIPVFVDEALPGDTFNLRMAAFARLATPLKPLMDNMYMETFFFGVPYRLVWDNWHKFNGEQENPDDSTDFLVPTMTQASITPSMLSGYFGLPILQPVALTFNSLHHRAYNLIWNEWFRDQNLQDRVVVDKDDGPDSPSDYFLPLRRGKRHDYFTSCLPWPQKGDSVALPLGTTANVIPDALGLGPSFRDFTGDTTDARLKAGAAGTLIPVNIESTVAFGDDESIHWDNPALLADLSTATSATINELRQAFQVQKLLERDARGGTRYTELIRSHFGVTSPDARLQRPEYLGGGSSPVQLSPVAQTSSTDATTPQGNLSAIGTASFTGHGFAKSFTEHTLLIGMVCVRADLTYQQGIDRMWSRQTRFDFYWPALSHIGEQAVLSKEIFADGSAGDDDVFGYQERYAEYRYKPGKITGLFNSNASAPLDVWHLSQEFATRPTLDDTFIVENPPIDRVIAVPTEPHFLFDSYFSVKCARPMPVFGVPGLIDHF